MKQNQIVIDYKFKSIKNNAKKCIAGNHRRRKERVFSDEKVIKQFTCLRYKHYCQADIVMTEKTIAEARMGFEPMIKDLQSSALDQLCYPASIVMESNRI